MASRRGPKFLAATGKRGMATRPLKLLVPSSCPGGPAGSKNIAVWCSLLVSTPFGFIGINFWRKVRDYVKNRACSRRIKPWLTNPGCQLPVLLIYLGASRQSWFAFVLPFANLKKKFQILKQTRTGHHPYGGGSPGPRSKASASWRTT